jgi:hypothetical protein
MKITYTADDGTAFDILEECIAHEMLHSNDTAVESSLQKLKRIFFAGCPMTRDGDPAPIYAKDLFLNLLSNFEAAMGELNSLENYLETQKAAARKRINARPKER